MIYKEEDYNFHLNHQILSMKELRLNNNSFEEYYHRLKSDNSKHFFEFF
jgi:hypothetical protein